jgi:ligand-binding sensor domain-containing protein
LSEAVAFLLQSRDGFFWAGTAHGIYAGRDGTFELLDCAGLPSADILTMHEDSDGNIWIGTPPGTSREDASFR